MGLVKTRRLAYSPLAGADDPWGSRQAERCDAETATGEGGDEAADGEEWRSCSPVDLAPETCEA